MEAIRGYKQELGIPFSPLDFLETGMIGDDYSDITTSLGLIEAKRTTADPDMAALLVRMFHEAGLSAGDSVGAGFSGSFPSLNLAVICACDAMGLKLTYISSVGASTHGANQPDLTFPDMAHRLYTDGLISTDSTMVSPGGDKDMGLGTWDQAAFFPILDRLRDAGIPILMEEDFQKNLATRRAIYEKQNIRCFVAVGGNITTMGLGDSALYLGQGLLKHTLSPDRLNTKSGLVEWYLAAGLPVINMLNIKKICAEYGIPYDPATHFAAGESPIYQTVTYPIWIPIVGLSVSALALGLFAFLKKREENKGVTTL